MILVFWPQFMVRWSVFYNQTSWVRSRKKAGCFIVFADSHSGNPSTMAEPIYGHNATEYGQRKRAHNWLWLAVGTASRSHDLLVEQQAWMICRTSYATVYTTYQTYFPQSSPCGLHALAFIWFCYHLIGYPFPYPFFRLIFFQSSGAHWSCSLLGPSSSL